MSGRSMTLVAVLITSLWSVGCCCTSPRPPEPALYESAPPVQSKNRIQPAGIGETTGKSPERLQGKVGP